MHKYSNIGRQFTIAIASTNFRINFLITLTSLELFDNEIIVFLKCRTKYNLKLIQSIFQSFFYVNLNVKHIHK